MKLSKLARLLRMKLYNEIYHHNYPNKELIRSMLASNAITEEELNLGDFVIKNVKDLYVMSKYEKGFRNSSKYTMADAFKDVNAEYTENTIPCLASYPDAVVTWYAHEGVVQESRLHAL